MYERMASLNSSRSDIYERKGMSEEQIKFLYKYAVEHSKRQFSQSEKELLKQAIDQATNIEELLSIAFASLNLGKQGQSDRII